MYSPDVNKNKMKNKLILCGGHGANIGKFEIHLNEISQDHNIISVIKDKDLAIEIVDSFNKPKTAKRSPSTIKELMDKLTDGERMSVILNYCKHCGDKNPSCQCWNDD